MPNSGPVLVSAIGNDLKMGYTVIGDTVNLASRMQSMAKPGTILVSPNTYKMTRDFFKFNPLGQSIVKGKEEQLEVYELLETGPAQTRFEAAIAKGLTKFVGRDKEIIAIKEAFELAQSGSMKTGHVTVSGFSRAMSEALSS